jgi:transketolase
MRNALSSALVSCAENPDFIFLAGDLGFNALEPLRDRLGDRFVNAGVSEQNMVSVAAGLARCGWRPWVYSIAPFLYARPLEQIRNDVCLHGLAVTFVGNGGGYGYGVMGATHHALEDYGILLTLPGLRAYLPAFAADVAPIIHQLLRAAHPSYLRLGRDEKPADFPVPVYAPWRKLIEGPGPVVVAVGPLAGSWLDLLLKLPVAKRPRLWVMTELPLETAEPPGEFWSDLKTSGRLIVGEEHVAHGGVGESLARLLLERGLAPRRFSHLSAKGYLSGRYGSQAFHRAESGLDAAHLLGELEA